MNLLANAVKFSKAAGLITLSAEMVGPEVVMKVVDTGIGIPAHLQATIFEQYEQAHDSRGGTGLGLADREGLRPGARRPCLGRVRGGARQLFCLHTSPGGPRLMRRLTLPLLVAWHSRPVARPRGRASRLPSRPTGSSGRRDARIQAGNWSGAIRILEDVVRRFPDAPVHDEALYQLARALVLSANSGREYRQAAGYLDRLLREHPTSPYAADARAWRSVLGAYAARGAELDRLARASEGHRPGARAPASAVGPGPAPPRHRSCRTGS